MASTRLPLSRLHSDRVSIHREIRDEPHAIDLDATIPRVPLGSLSLPLCFFSSRGVIILIVGCQFHAVPALKLSVSHHPLLFAMPLQLSPQWR